jgi:hypothetical protein
MGRTFPHPLGDSPVPDFYATLRFAPQGDELTADFAKTIVEAEQLGADEAADMLAVSFSATVAAVLGIVPRSGSTGEVLVEVFGETSRAAR